jgi:high affinity sulfate transporter 1
MNLRALRRRSSDYIPILRWLPRYRRSWLGADVLAGVVVASLAIPTALGYAGVADVPVQAGLYALPLALLAYAIFGSSRQLSVGPSSTVALMSGTTVIAVAGTDDPARAVALSSAIAIAAGVLLTLSGVFRIGWITDFLSRPVIVGFTFGLGILVISSELPHLLGLPQQPSDFLYRSLLTLQEVGLTNPWTLGIGIVTIAVLLIGKQVAPRFPWALSLMAIAIAAAPLLDPTSKDIEVIGAVPQGLPPLGLPAVSLSDLPTVLVGGFAVALVAVGEGLSASRIFAASEGYRVSSDQELVGTGSANIAAGFSGGIAVCGSLSRTATAVSSGARTQMSSLTAMVAVLVVLVAFTDLLQELPRVILSAVVIVSVLFLLDFRSIRRYRTVRRSDFVSSLTALFGVLLLGPLYGLLAAVAISILGLIYRANHVVIDPIGRISAERAGWGALKGHPERTAIPGLLILRLGSPIFWANAAATADRVMEEVDAEPTAQGVVLVLEATGQLDTSSADALEDLYHSLENADVQLFIARLNYQARVVLERTGFIDELGESHIWHSITQTVDQACLELDLDAHVPPDWAELSQQSRGSGGASANKDAVADSEDD